MPGITYSLGLDPAGAIGGIKSFMGAFSGMAGMLAPMAGIAGGLGAVGLAVAGFKKSIDEAAKMEGLQTGFKVLLGSMDAAKERMKQLAAFADNTPFELPQVAEASRVLETFTKGALSTGKGLTLVGDVASGTGREFQEIAPLIGQLFQELNSASGGEGRAAMELMRMGALSADAKEKIEKLQHAGVHGMPLWNIAMGDMSRYTGMMAEMSHTWTGLLSTFKDKVDSVFREFGAPVLDSIKPLLADAISYTDGLKVKAHQWGTEVAGVIDLLRNMFSAGDLAEFAGLSLRVGFADAVDFLGTEMKKVLSSFDGANMFSGLDQLFQGFGEILSGSIMKSIAAGLRGTRLGAAITDQTGWNNVNMAGNASLDVGHQDVNEATAQMSKLGGVAGSLGNVLTGLNQNADDARKSLKGLGNLSGEMTAVSKALNDGVTQSFTNQMPSIGDALAKTLGESLKKFFPGLNIAPPGMGTSASEKGLSNPEEHIKPLTDRMARIGLFLGGKGGGSESPEKAHQAELAKSTQGLKDMGGVLGTVRNSLASLGEAAALAGKYLGGITGGGTGAPADKSPASPPVAGKAPPVQQPTHMPHLPHMPAPIKGDDWFKKELAKIPTFKSEITNGTRNLQDAFGDQRAPRPDFGSKPVPAMPTIPPFSSLLARAGQFVGNNGGVRNERGAAETAKNTGKMISQIDKLIEHMSPRAAGATF